MVKVQRTAEDWEQIHRKVKEAMARGVSKSSALRELGVSDSVYWNHFSAKGDFAKKAKPVKSNKFVEFKAPDACGFKLRTSVNGECLEIVTDSAEQMAQMIKVLRGAA